MFLRAMFITRLALSLGATLFSLVFAVLSTHKATLLVFFLGTLMLSNMLLNQSKNAITTIVPEENVLSRKEISQKLVLLKSALELQPSHQDLLYNTISLQAITNQDSTENDSEDLQSRLQRVSPALFTEL